LTRDPGDTVVPVLADVSVHRRDLSRRAADWSVGHSGTSTDARRIALVPTRPIMGLHTTLLLLTFGGMANAPEVGTASPEGEPSAPEGRDSRIVIFPIDGSVHSERALSWYLDNMRAPNDHAVFINVIEPVYSSPAFGMSMESPMQPDIARVMESSIASGKKLCQNKMKHAKELALPAEAFLHVDSRPGHAIIKAVGGHHGDVVVMGSRGMGVIRRTFLGSVSDYVLHHSHVPVVIVPPPEEKLFLTFGEMASDGAGPQDAGSEGDKGRVILFPIDGSTHSERAFAWYLDKMRSPNDRALFVSVIEPLHTSHAFGMAMETSTVPELERAMELRTANCKQLCRDKMKQAKEHELPSQAFLYVDARPGNAVVKAVERCNANIVVMGNRGLSGVRRTVLGSVSDYVLHHSYVPV
ncbi:universal stress family protein, partial [Opisthorchis viverrini]